MNCTCDSSLFSPGTQDCPLHWRETQAAAAAEAASEMAAENAWLVAAEAPSNDDLGFEAWEAARVSPAEYDRCLS